MRYVSTRGGVEDASFARVLLEGLAPDGGLYVPADWPRAPSAAGAIPYAELTTQVLSAFVGESLSPEEIRAAAEADAASFSHDAVTPLVQLAPNLWLLELFHGPTLAFKDCAMQLVAPLTAAALGHAGEELLLLTATSGDTGAAAVRAFAGAPRVRLAVLHPKGRVSDVQRRQMTTTDADNILNLCVHGDFDDCQRMVKALLADPDLRAGRRVSSVNSINWGRVVGQIPYYLAAAAPFQTGARFVVPTGNFGDAFAGWAAKAMGAGVVSLTAAVNQNDALARALDEGRYARRPAAPTASVSMDVQAPSNFERLIFEASGRDAIATRALFDTFAADGDVALPEHLLAALRAEVSAVSISEE
ncbi:MAG: threonine synthase, partial [Caulobacterales bacterium]|nr:threonine synthase [Caulobacterales bacterium]